MTIFEFKGLRVGDVLLDGNHRRARRKIYAIKRVSGTRGQGTKTRVAITCTNLKSNGSRTIIFVSDEIGSARFELARKAVAEAGVQPTTPRL